MFSFQVLSTASTLKRHIDHVHIGARPFECPLCGEV